MSYIPTEWKNGDVITSEKLNKIENGIANAGGGTDILFATFDTSTRSLDKTWQELASADVAYLILANATSTWKLPVVDCIKQSDNLYYVAALGVAEAYDEDDKLTFEPMIYTFKATSADGYPTFVM